MTMRERDASPALSRRALLSGAVALALVPTTTDVALADADDLAAAMREALGEGYTLNEGRVKVRVPELAENGNVVPLRVQVESPMTADDHVKTVFVFSEKNPIANVARFHLGPRSGQARVQTNIRLAATQNITIVARMSNGELWSTSAKVIVTQGACIDDT
jgi:sulfur-oxidizing protein SoxY